MLLLYGIPVAALPSTEKLKSYLGDAWTAVWRERHPGCTAEDAMRRSLGGLCLLRIALPGARLAYTSAGRPYLPDGEAECSITHTEDWIFCAVCVSKDGTCPSRVGVDAENGQRLSSSRLEALSSRWFSPQEQRLFLEDPSSFTFLRIWTRKEALVKWTGQGMAGLRSSDTTRAEKDLALAYAEYTVEGTLVSLCYPPSLSAPATPTLLHSWEQLTALKQPS